MPARDIESLVTGQSDYSQGASPDRGGLGNDCIVELTGPACVDSGHGAMVGKEKVLPGSRIFTAGWRG
jgi:hypothetical protein